MKKLLASFVLGIRPKRKHIEHHRYRRRKIRMLLTEIANSPEELYEQM